MRILGGFRTRSAERDLETDNRRRQRLCAAIGAIEAEVRSELTGIRARYEAASVDAAFLLEAIESREANSATRLDELSHALIAYETRVKELSRQVDFLVGLRESASSFGRPPEPADN